MSSPVSSRLVVKNLPKYATEKRIEEHFATKGHVTDVKLARTKDGSSRRFAFVGYQSEKEAATAQKFFEGTFMDTSKLSIEFAIAVDDPSLPRPWSKYSKGSSSHEKWAQGKAAAASASKDAAKGNGRGIAEQANKKTPRQTPGADIAQEIEETKKKVATLYGGGGNAADPALQEFLQVMKPRSKTTAWSNDDAIPAAPTPVSCSCSSPPPFISILFPYSCCWAFFVQQGKVEAVVTAVASRKTGGSGLLLTKTHVKFGGDSDEEYEELPSGKRKDATPEKEDENENEIGDSVDDSASRPGSTSTPLSDLEYLRSKMKFEDAVPSSDKEEAPAENDDEEEEKEEEKEKATTGEEADGKVEGKRPQANPGVKGKTGPEEAEKESPESIVMETGRLFIRNLAFVCTEDDLRGLLKKFGPLSEVHIPIDKETKKPRGYAYALYLLPEHAVQITSLGVCVCLLIPFLAAPAQGVSRS